MKKNVTEELLALLTQNKGLQSIIDYGYKLFDGKIIALVSTSGKILAYKHKSDIQNFANAQLKDGYLDEVTYRICQNENLLSKFQTEHHAFMETDVQRENTTWLFDGVRVGSTVVAYFAIVGDKKGFSNEDMENAHYLSQAFSVVLAKDDFEMTNIKRSNSVFINEILEGTINDEDQIDLMIKRFGLEKFDSMKLIVMVRDDDASDIALRSIIHTVINQYFKSCISTIYNGKIITIVKAEDIFNANKVLVMEQLLEDLNQNQIRLGISNSFQKYSQLPYYYNQAEKALAYGKAFSSNATVCTYTDYSIYDFLGSSTLNLRELCNPVLYSMFHSEDELTREEVRSLFLYVKYMKNAKLVSELLHIHKNTLFHRINKVVQAANLDMSDGNDVFQIMMTDKILQYFSSNQFK